MEKDSNIDMSQQDASISQLDSNGTCHPVMQPRRSPKQKVTLSLSTSLIERLRNAVYRTGNRPLASLVEEALEAVGTEMEEVNREAFPQRLSPLKAGRRQGKRASASSTPVSYRKSAT
jgi:ferredoxin-NADP reductase